MKFFNSIFSLFTGTKKRKHRTKRHKTRRNKLFKKNKIMRGG